MFSHHTVKVVTRPNSATRMRVILSHLFCFVANCTSHCNDWQQELESRRCSKQESNEAYKRKLLHGIINSRLQSTTNTSSTNLVLDPVDSQPSKLPISVSVKGTLLQKNSNDGRCIKMFVECIKNQNNENVVVLNKKPQIIISYTSECKEEDAVHYLVLSTLKLRGFHFKSTIENEFNAICNILDSLITIYMFAHSRCPSSSYLIPAEVHALKKSTVLLFFLSLNIYLEHFHLDQNVKHLTELIYLVFEYICPLPKVSELLLNNMQRFGLIVHRRVCVVSGLSEFVDYAIVNLIYFEKNGSCENLLSLFNEIWNLLGESKEKAVVAELSRFYQIQLMDSISKLIEMIKLKALTEEICSVISYISTVIIDFLHVKLVYFGFLSESLIDNCEQLMKSLDLLLMSRIPILRQHQAILFIKYVEKWMVFQLENFAIVVITLILNDKSFKNMHADTIFECLNICEWLWAFYFRWHSHLKIFHSTVDPLIDPDSCTSDDSKTSIHSTNLNSLKDIYFTLRDSAHKADIEIAQCNFHSILQHNNWNYGITLERCICYWNIFVFVNLSQRVCYSYLFENALDEWLKFNNNSSSATIKSNEENCEFSSMSELEKKAYIADILRTYFQTFEMLDLN